MRTKLDTHSLGLVLGLIAFLHARPLAAQQGLYITELMGDNVDALADEELDHPDWCEIANAGTAAVNLEGYTLSDDVDVPAMWPLPAVTLQPGAFLLVFCSGKDRRAYPGELHTNFQLSASGETLAIFNPSGNPVSSVTFPRQVPDASWGLGMDSTSEDVIVEGASARIFVPLNGTLDATWKAPEFVDSAWREGPTPVGFATGVTPPIATDLTAEMRNQGSTVYLRMGFAVADPVAVDTVVLSMNYDDGFAAYLNGTLVASANAPANPVWDSRATGSHTASGFVKFDISEHRGLLRSGQNVLAVIGLNTTTTNNDVYVCPRLELSDLREVRTGERLYFEVPTPAAPNREGFIGVVPRPRFSQESRAFDAPTSISITADFAEAAIRYTLDGTVPTAASTLYTGPISVTTTARIIARAFADGLLPSAPEIRHYQILNSNVKTFNSNIPLVICSTLGKAMGSNCGAGAYTGGTLWLIEPGTDGRARITDKPTVGHSAGFRRRGSSTCGNPKFSFNVEFWDVKSRDENVGVFDFAADSDYVMYAPYNFDRAILQNALAYWMSREVGPWAPRTRFVECFFHTQGTPLSSANYVGIYIFMERNKRNPDRVDVARLGPRDIAEPAVTGGYIFKRDRVGADEIAISAGGYGSLVFVYPNAPVVAQRTWITSYLTQAIASLNPNIGSQDDSQYIEFTDWIDHHILCWYPKNVDAFRLSGFFHKNREGRMVMGPVWDYDRTMGCADDDRAADPTGWDNRASGDGGTKYFQAGDLGSWYSKLFNNVPPTGDSPWAVAYRARWRELRKGPLRTDHIMAQIDDWAEELNEAATRNFQKWPGTAPRFGGFQGEISNLKNWLSTRADWIDAQFIAKPTFSIPAGLVAAGTQVEILIESTAAIYYTLDGTDPKGTTGAPSASARLYTGPITIDRNVRIIAQSLESGAIWSGTTTALYVVKVPELIVTELMYAPLAPTLEEDPQHLYTASKMEFIELKNVGAETASLLGVKFSRGVTFDFEKGTVKELAPGEILVIPANVAALAARYGDSGIRVPGAYSGVLSDAGEAITLLGPLGTAIVEFTYSGTWYPEAQGAGRSIANVDPLLPPEGLGDPLRWKASADPLGSPGRDDGPIVPEGLQFPGDMTQDGKLNISDPISILRLLFAGGEGLPCEVEGLESPGNTALLDWQADGKVDVSDALGPLNYLFGTGPMHALGASCIAISGCSETCVGD